MNAKRSDPLLYAGNLSPKLWQYDHGYIGLALNPRYDRDIKQDMTQPLEFEDECAERFQCEDVFEHLPYEKLPAVFEEVYRVLKPGGLFRLSVPDYRCPYLLKRSVYDSAGRIVYDPGGTGRLNSQMQVVNGGHVWFPTIETVRSLYERSPFREPRYLEYWDETGNPVKHPIDYSLGHIQRTSQHDRRVKDEGIPMSIVVDAIK